MSNIDEIVEGALFTEVKKLKDGKSIVMDPATERLYYKKVLSVYSVPVFRFIQTHHHKNIPVIKIFWKEDGNLVVIEELIQGKTIDELLESGDNISFEEKKRILLEICDGLEFLHSAIPPIIHRDIKASNIIISEDGSVKIIDYDAAKQYIANKEKDTVLIGTQGIAAPEQYGFGQSDERTDIYALGKLIQRMLPDSKHAMQIVEKATKLEPDKRYRSIKEIRSSIEKLWDPKISDSEHRRIVVSKRVKSKGFIAGAVCLLIIAVLSVGGYIFKTKIYPEYYIRKPAYEAGVNAMNSENYEEAIKQFQICGTDYNDSKDLVDKCRINLIKDEYISEAEDAIEKYKETGYGSDARKAIEKCKMVQTQRIDNGEMLNGFYEYMIEYAFAGIEVADYSRGNSVFKILSEFDYEDLEELRTTYAYQRGQKEYDDGNYEEAVMVWTDIRDYKDTKEKILDARYKYVKANLDSTNGTTKVYLKLLKEAGYKDLDVMESALDVWKVELSFGPLHISNSSPSSNSIYLYLYVAGGPSGEAADLKIVITNSSGQSTTIEKEDSLRWHDKQKISWVAAWQDFGPEDGKTYHFDIYVDGELILSTDKTMEK